MSYSKSQFYHDNTWQLIPGATEIARRYRQRIVAVFLLCFFAPFGSLFLLNERVSPLVFFVVLALFLFFWLAPFVFDFAPRVKCPCCGIKMAKIWETRYPLEGEALFFACQPCKKFVALGVSRGGLS